MKMDDQLEQDGGSEDRLLLAEAVHRAANEAASALAALHLVGAARGAKSQRRILDAAVSRIEGFGRINRLLCQSFRARQDLGAALDQLANSVLAGRMVRGDGRLVLDLPEIWVEGETARRVLLIAYELICNAVTHVMEMHGGRLVVSLHWAGPSLLLDISDDGPGLAAASSTSSTRLGSRIVAELVRGGGGTLECHTGSFGTSFRVVLPLDGSSRAPFAA